MRRLLLLLVLVLVPVPAAQAGTATSTVERDCAGDEADPACFAAHAVAYRAAPGERNDVTVALAEGVVTIRDTGTPPAAGTGCASAAPDTVRCAVNVVAEPGRDVQFSITADLGDGDDRAQIGDLFAPVDSVFLVGGPGADVLRGGDTATSAVSRAVQGPRVWLVGGDGADEVLGGVLSDILYGGGGSDVLRGGAGSDLLDGEGELGTRTARPEADVLDGGDGHDVVSYAERRAPVTVDLADPGPDGEAGEGDTIVAVEGVRGSMGPNVLRGDDGPNHLVGSSVAGAADVLDGRGGHDLLEGGGGLRDQLLGGPGNDRIGADAGNRVCAEGVDVLLGWIGGLPPADCERVVLSGQLRVDVRALWITGRSIGVRVRNETSRAISGTVSIRGRPHDRIVRRRFSLRAGASARLTLRVRRPLPVIGRVAPRFGFTPGGGIAGSSLYLRRP